MLYIQISNMATLKDSSDDIRTVYQPFDTPQQIRVLKLHPGEASDTVEGTLVITSLLEAPNRAEPDAYGFWVDYDRPKAISSWRVYYQRLRTLDLRYDAVSYTWGTSAEKCEMMINGVLCNVPASTLEVLIGLRSSSAPSVLWIDAICINQNDLDEKAAQVAMMGDIYIQAAQTYIWLGQPTDLTKRALDFCRQLRRDIEVKLAQRGSQIFDRYDSILLGVENDTGALNAAMSEIGIPESFEPAVLEEIFLHPWFQRLWVFQEVALSARCTGRIGPHDIPWVDVVITATWWKGSRRDPYTMSEESDSTINLATEFTADQLAYQIQAVSLLEGTPLSELLKVSGVGLQVSNLHDGIYAVLSLTTWSRLGLQLPEAIHPDYRKSFRSCMRDAAIEMIREDGDLNILATTCLPLEGGNGVDPPEGSWPSWTPLSYAPWPENLRKPLSDTFWADKRQSAGGGIRLTADLDGLLLSGLQLGPIQWLSESLGTDAGLDQVPLFKGMLVSRGFSKADTLMLLTAEKYDNDRYTIDEVNATAHLRSEPFAIVLRTENLRPSRIITDEPARAQHIQGDLDEMHISFVNAVMHRRAFLMAGGRAGLAPQNARVGDVVVILFGGSVPFVLRPMEHDGHSKWALIGACYVLGEMDGRAVRSWEDNGAAVPQIFEIR